MEAFQAKALFLGVPNPGFYPGLFYEAPLGQSAMLKRSEKWSYRNHPPDQLKGLLRRAGAVLTMDAPKGLHSSAQGSALGHRTTLERTLA